MKKELDRRKFIKTTALAGLGTGLALSSNAQTQKTAPSQKSKINIGVIGVGLRGSYHVELALDRKDCQVVAICDIDQGMIDRTKAIFTKKGKTQPKVYGLHEKAYLELLEDKNIDAVVIATPWRWHTEMAVAAMQAGKYVGLEVSGAFSVDECWQLVNTHEATGSHLFFLENVCYRRDVMAILNMVRQDLFGELIHLECGYQHDLRGVKFNDGKTPYDSGVEYGAKGYSEARWRTQHSIHRNGDLYPTHGIGPVAQYINLNRGNRLLSLTSTSSKARGLHQYILDHPKGGANHPNANLEFKLGDVTTTVLKAVNGESIIISHDTSLPRPYSLGFRVQGTKGIWMAVNKSIHLAGTSPKHRWEEAKPYLEKYDHPLWKRYEAQATGAGHGGMDFFLAHSFVEHAKRNASAPFDVYDAATWMAITPLSEESIALGSQSVAIPDFTRGRWINRAAVFALGDDY